VFSFVSFYVWPQGRECAAGGEVWMGRWMNFGDDWLAGWWVGFEVAAGRNGGKRTAREKAVLGGDADGVEEEDGDCKGGVCTLAIDCCWVAGSCRGKRTV
jgi:hypothetical protein